MGSFVHCLLRNCFENQERNSEEDDCTTVEEQLNNITTDFMQSSAHIMTFSRPASSSLYEHSNNNIAQNNNPLGGVFLSSNDTDCGRTSGNDNTPGRLTTRHESAATVTEEDDELDNVSTPPASSPIASMGNSTTNNIRRADLRPASSVSSFASLMQRFRGLTLASSSNVYGSLGHSAGAATLVSNNNRGGGPTRVGAGVDTSIMRPSSDTVKPLPEDVKLAQPGNSKHTIYKCPLRTAVTFQQSNQNRHVPAIKSDEVVLPGSLLQKQMALSMSQEMCFDIDDDECVICMEVFDPTNPRMPTLCGCGENKTYFHLPCLYQWIEQSENCPSCREKLTWEEF